MPRWRWMARGLLAGTAGLTALAAVPSLAADASIALAQKAMKSGKADLALRALSAALDGGGLKGVDIARAYYLRGLANVKSGNAAAGIADLSHALWLKGLSDAERKEATAAKAAAYQKAGVAVGPDTAPAATTDPAPAAQAAPAADPSLTAKPATAKARKTKPPPPDDQTASADALPWQSQTGTAILEPSSTTPAAAPPPAQAASATETDGGAITSALGSLFGFSQPEPAAAAVAPAPASQLASADAGSNPDAAAADWQPAKPPKASLAASKQRAPAKGGVYVQVASLRTEGEAQSMASKLAGDHAATLAGIGTTVTPTVIGNMGTFYTVRVGPIASKAAGQSLCAKLHTEGVDCFFASP